MSDSRRDDTRSVIERLNEQTARQKNYPEHRDDCICNGKGYFDGIGGPVKCHGEKEPV
jgi:hypothetical protein